MRVGIVVAMEKELDALCEHLAGVERHKEGNVTFAWCEAGGHRIMMAQCGVGKVHATLSTMALAHHGRPECILSVGCSGGIGLESRPEEVVIADGVGYHDVYCGDGQPKGQIQDMPQIYAVDGWLLEHLQASLPGSRTGLFSCGEYFMPGEKEIEFVRMLYPKVVAMDMESGAVGQVCYLLGTPFASVRAVSDTPGLPDVDSRAQYAAFWGEGYRLSFGRIVEALKALPETL